MKQSALAGLVIIFLSACGGSSNNGSLPLNPKTQNPPVVTVPAPTAIINNTLLSIYGQTSANLGESVGFSLLATSGNRVTQIRWQQISGPNVNLLADHTQTIGFDVTVVGNYQLNVSGKMSSGDTFSQTIAFDVISDGTTRPNIRRDHAASELANISLRIDADSDKSITNYLWRQVAGTIDVSLQQEQEFVFIDAPAVSKDEIVIIEGTLEYTDGTSATDVSQIVIKNVEINEDGFFPRYSEKVVSTDIFPYIGDSPFAQALKSCVYNNLVTRSCQFSQLPLIGKDNLAPTNADILQRLLVSHAWMGQRFEQLLETSIIAEDIRKLLRATTAIVISYDVRPSFYWSATGAIYLDAKNFWVTPAERDTLNFAPDYRSEFGKQLQFAIPWRYIKDDQYYINSSDYPLNQRLTRTITDLEASVSWLMYHELGHANDFFPPTSWSLLSDDDSPLSYANNHDANSSSFAQSYPLSSQEMKSLGQVSFFGESPSTIQKNYSPDEVVNFFEPDKAPAYYSYSTIREDYATLFERFMMLYRLNALADTAIVELDDEQIYIVAWGQRNRVNHPSIQARTLAVVEQILPEIDVQAQQQVLPGIQQFRRGIGYYEQINLNQDRAKNKALQKPDKLLKRDIFRDMSDHHYGRPILPKQ